MTALGIMFKREYPPEDLPEFARKTEAAGFDELWVIEDCFYAGGIAQAAVALAHTQTIRVGLGIMPAVARNPAFTALEIASLARIAPNRFLPGIGHGVDIWMRQIGAFPKSQIRALEENVIAVRAILHGESVTMRGDYVQLDAVQLEFPLDSVPPIQLGVRGPKSLHVAGKVADGAILAEGCSPAYVRWARERMNAGRKEANRTDSARVTVYIYWSMDDNISVAQARVRERLAARIAAGKMDVYLNPLGLAGQAAEMIVQGGESNLRDHMPEEWLRQMAVVGSVADCAQTIRQLADAGVDSVTLIPLMDNEAALTTHAQALMSQLR
jgi:alkanesulfonate monooxygenase SsuD/methylene tetrahydromethanopterin reductase-like flavin-dependent oxidoreductase (luciferase family)